MDGRILIAGLGLAMWLAIWYFDPYLDETEEDEWVLWYGRGEKRKYFKF